MKKPAFIVYLAAILVLIVVFYITESGNNKAVYIPDEVSENLYSINESTNSDKIVFLEERPLDVRKYLRYIKLCIIMNAGGKGSEAKGTDKSITK